MNKRDVDKIIAQNEKRKEELFSPYDPVMGIGSPIDRVPVFYYNSQKKPVMVPKSMAETELFQSISNFKTIEAAAKAFNQPVDFLVNLFQELRLDHDFEFFAATCITIEHKETKQLSKFRLRKAQRNVLKIVETERLARRPIRINVVKSRQWGSSTFVQCYFFWMQTRIKKNWHSATAAHLDDAAKNIREMYSTIAREYPEQLGSITLVPHAKSSKNQKVKETGSIVAVGSSQTPDNLRGYSFAMLHMSEVAYYVSTTAKSPRDLAQTLASTVPLSPDTIIFRESTPNGVGNYFYEVSMNAHNGKSKYISIYVPFFEIEIYQMEIEDKVDFIKSMNDYAWELWEKGATLESINWYYTFKETEEYDDWRMKSEYSSDIIEAFQTSGTPYFAPSIIVNAQRSCRPPLFKAQVFADSKKGPDALKNVTMEKVTNGDLWIWSEPEYFPDIRVLNRYLVTLDIGGRSKESDESIIKVFDRYWLMEGGALEVAAVWAGHLDFDHLAWLAVQICKLYDDAFYVPEVNKMREDFAATEGFNFYTIIDQVVDYYHNIFFRNTPDKIRQGIPGTYGWNTNVFTKEELLNALNAGLRDGTYIELDQRAIDQYRTFETKPDGKKGAIDGAHDDHVIASGIGTAVGLMEKYMPPPKIVKLNNGPVLKKRYLGPSTI